MQCPLLLLLLLVHTSLQSQDLVVVPSDSGTEADAEVRVEDSAEEAEVSSDQVEQENCVP